MKLINSLREAFATFLHNYIDLISVDTGKIIFDYIKLYFYYCIIMFPNRFTNIPVIILEKFFGSNNIITNQVDIILSIGFILIIHFMTSKMGEIIGDNNIIPISLKNFFKPIINPILSFVNYFNIELSEDTIILFCVFIILK